MKRWPTFVSFLGLVVVVRFLTGCSPADWAAVDVAGKAARGVACAICGGSAPVQEQAAEHARALREIAEAIAALAAVVDPARAEATRAELAALQARERHLTEQLVKLAASAASSPEAPP